jgi:hypothetical protein
MLNDAELNFVRQQGFSYGEGAESRPWYNALMFQPRITAVLVVVGLVLQAWLFFLVLSLISWWNVLLPALNPYDYLYNRLVASPRGLPKLTPAPLPRRFAQGMAGTFMLAVGVLLLARWYVAAGVVEAMLVGALGALLFGKFCLGSYIFHLIRGQARFANDTLPWVHA